MKARGRQNQSIATTTPKAPAAPQMLLYLAQPVPFAEGLVGHVPELLGNGTGTPAGGVVLDHGGHKLGHLQRPTKGNRVKESA